MKKLLLIITLISTSSIYGQYSDYYYVDEYAYESSETTEDDNEYTYKNIATIDYKVLHLINAKNERNRLKNAFYDYEGEKEIALEVAINPIEGFEFGIEKTDEVTNEIANYYGFKKFNISYITPHSSLFINTGTGRYKNVSADGVTTTIVFNAPRYNVKDLDYDILKEVELKKIKVGELNKATSINGDTALYVHKKEVTKSTVFGASGYLSTIIWEDFSMYTISDNYLSFDTKERNGIWHSVKVKYCGDNETVTFEQLEGRKHYLKPLIEMIIATGEIWDIKHLK